MKQHAQLQIARAAYLRRVSLSTVGYLILSMTACGRVDAPKSMPDSHVETPDSNPAPSAAPAREIAVAAGRLTGGRLVVDVQLGAVDQSRVSAGSVAAVTSTSLNP